MKLSDKISLHVSRDHHIKDELIEDAEALEQQIEAMKKCYVKLTDSPIFLDNGGVVYAADRKLMSEFDDAFEDEIKTG